MQAVWLRDKPLEVPLFAVVTTTGSARSGERAAIVILDHIIEIPAQHREGLHLRSNGARYLVPENVA